ncbi:hypothetical protein KKC88_04120, partial [Patescibacteria group bacterium]|nr:hypothetical protein [Patescibacteria group bacterium]
DLLNLNNIEINNFNAVNVEDECDLLLSSEVLQRMEDKEDYIKRGKAISKQQVIFAPNAGNDSHNKLSGLQSVSLEEMTKLTQGKAGYLDFPPFPPGIKRSEEQKEKAKSGMFENFAMKGLEGWAWSEKFYPDFIKEKFAHIVYGIS